MNTARMDETQSPSPETSMTDGLIDEGTQDHRVKAPTKYEDQTMKKDAVDTLEIQQYVFPSTAIADDSKLSYNYRQNTGLASRQGRATQRWVCDDDQPSEPIRLVTGCVPILQGGRVLMASSSRQKDWILPKGGWENDETMEESAGREAYEEAGVVGVLGAPLSEIKYETRKSKNRKMQQQQQQQTIDDRQPGTPKNVPETLDAVPSPSPPPSKTTAVPKITPDDKFSTANRVGSSSSASSPGKASTKLPPNGKRNYSWVRMTLFPLYVTEVTGEWPESDRLRSVVPIDKAIEILAGRPEFKRCLLELKERDNYHLPPPFPSQRSAIADTNDGS